MSDSLGDPTQHGNCPECGAGYVEIDGRAFCVECGAAKGNSTESGKLAKIMEPLETILTLAIAVLMVPVGVSVLKAAREIEESDLPGNRLHRFGTQAERMGFICGVVLTSAVIIAGAILANLVYAPESPRPWFLPYGAGVIAMYLFHRATPHIVDWIETRYD